MIRTSSQKKLSRQQRTLYFIMIGGLFVLIIANIFAWLYLQRIKTFFISDLKFRLENIARSASELIDANDLDVIIPGDESDPQILYYQQVLIDVKNNNLLQDIQVLSPDLSILVSSNPVLGNMQQRLQLEQNLVNQARGGQYAVSELQWLGDNPFMTAVAPLINSNNLVNGILVIEAPAQFFSTLDLYDKSLTVFSVINGLVILSVAALFFRSVNRVVKLQDQIRQQEHLVTLGEMAAAVAHEIRNPLAIIKGTNSLIQKKYGKGEDDLFAYIPDELDRLNQLIDDFLTFARRREPQYQTIAIEHLFEKLKIGYLDFSEFKLQLQNDTNISEIETDPDLFEQVLLNIVQNSFQALDGRGEVKILVRKYGKTVHFEISDNGPGIVNADVSRIFEPFYSTRERGSGLGLAISRQICEQLGGQIRIASGEQGGTTVTILLPIKGVA